MECKNLKCVECDWRGTSQDALLAFDRLGAKPFVLPMRACPACDTDTTEAHDD